MSSLASASASASAAGSSGAVPAPEDASGRSPFGLRGPAWLVWREHRAWFRLWMVCSFAMTCYLVYWHVRYHATFAALTSPASDSTGLPPDLGLTVAASLLAVAPALTAVTFGAPLFEREYTYGTARLVGAQSTSDAAWVRAKLGVPAVMVLACVTPCAAAFTWDVRVDYAMGQNWYGVGVFDAIGPAAVGFCLVGLFLGAAAGLTWRRGAPSKMLGLGLVLAFEAAVFQVLPHLLPSTYGTTAWSSGEPYAIPQNAWVLTSGDLIAAGSPVARYARYLPYRDVVPLQWIVTGICVGACGVLALYCLRSVRRRPR